MATKQDGREPLKGKTVAIWGLFLIIVLLGVAGIFYLLPRWLSPARVGQEAPAPNRSAEPTVLDLVPAREVLAEACRALWEFRTVHAEEASADLAERRRKVAIRSASKLYRAFREPLAERGEMCRDGDTVFRFDDGGAVVWRIARALEAAGGGPELIGVPGAVLRRELLEDFRERIVLERPGDVGTGGALASTIADAVGIWRFSPDELGLTDKERRDVAPHPGRPKTGAIPPRPRAGHFNSSRAALQ